ncbi:MFS transporter [Chondromyces apiculatus]|uniref:Major facilitator family transporter n=1 Tax=Chondromyces apiculatus DSM 436 TaxID=1192034 RepID=A0A017TB93_9BACT|nr:MFS transporter [Chondromyces apiculatus]EYF06187.1 Major facilitator family transporter [Chondromyces apiculatus DSM 436]
MSEQPAPPPESLSPALTTLFATACGAIVANIYYAQPLVGLIGPDIGLGKELSSLVVTLTQLGYGAGLLLLVPLGDMVQNRPLIRWMLAAVVLSLVLSAVAPHAAVFLVAALLTGVSSCVVQMLLPLAAHMAPDATRGRVVGNVMGGLLLGILLARPVSGIIADAFGWRAVFWMSAALMAVFWVVLPQLLPDRKPAVGAGYRAMLSSLWPLLRDTPVLRRRAAYQAGCFAAFSLFWTAVPLELAGPRFHFSQRQIALFALAGAAGAAAAPLAGRLADRGMTKPATGLALGLAAASFFVMRNGFGLSAIGMVVAVIALDFAVQTNQVLGQRAIYALGAEVRNRLTGIYMALLFLGGATGSALASVLMARGGWDAVTLAGTAFPLAALLLFGATEGMKPSAPRDVAV